MTLAEISHAAAQQHSWPTVHVGVKRSDLIPELTTKLLNARQLFEGTVPTANPARTQQTRITGTKVQASVLGVGAGVELSRGATGASSLREKRGRRLPTYLERAEWHPLKSLPAVDAQTALTGPASQSGRPMSQDAADILLRQSGGYPYAIQVAGHFAWRASTGSGTIAADHAEKALPRIAADLDQLFLSRWEDASARERDYLTALASAEQAIHESHGGQVAAVMNEPVQAVSYLRDRLIKKGTIYRSSSGGLHFITPGMGE